MDELTERLSVMRVDVEVTFGEGAFSSVQPIGDVSAQAILAEIAKTHRLVKLSDKDHGTYTMYTNGRCRCDLCRQANTERGRRYREDKRG